MAQKPKDASFEQEMRDLSLERQGLVRILFDMEEKNTFNFLSDEGLLPNYAFPEAGVMPMTCLLPAMRISGFIAIK